MPDVVDLSQLHYNRRLSFVTGTTHRTIERIGEVRPEDGRILLLLTARGQNVNRSRIRIYGDRLLREGHKWPYAFKQNDTQVVVWTHRVEAITG